MQFSDRKQRALKYPHQQVAFLQKARKIFLERKKMCISL
jgi:hypothetical protein